MPEELMTVEEVAERLKMNPETVRRYLRSGELKGIAFSNKVGWRITEQDLQEFIAKKRAETLERWGR